MPTIDEYKQIADLLFPDVNKTPEDYYKMYPARKLGENAEVTRVAPSPTGFFHIGTFYQVLINRLVAKNGIFYLRIEDTDEKREVAGTADIIYPIINRFGVKIDEGYVVGGEERGDYGPYIQSKRKNIYRCFAKDLVSRGLAYPCFCDGDDEKAKEEQLKLGMPLGYYGKWAKCRDLSLEQIKQNLNEGKKFTIRIKADGDGVKRFIANDLVKGNVSFPVNNMDYIILKSDGQALYHLAHLVDDTLMHTTTVVRGEEWFPSVPLHYQLFRYMGLEHPKYLHTPLIMTIDQETKTARKISKRKDAWANSLWFFEQGYPTSAVIEYLLNLINSRFEPWREQNPEASVGDFEFRVDNFSKSGAMFDILKLDNIAKNKVSLMTGDEVYNATLNWAKEYNKNQYELLKNNESYCKQVFNMDKNQARPRKDITTFSQVVDFYSYMFDETYKNDLEFNCEKFNKEIIKNALNLYLSKFDINDDKETWFNKMKEVADECGFCSDMKIYKQNPAGYYGSIADFSGIIRVALTGKTQTPDLYAIIQLLGKEKVIKRLNNAIK